MHNISSIHTIKEQTLKLLPEKCIFWIEEQAIIMSDLHLGKSQHFRKNGIQAPLSIIQQEISRLSSLFKILNPQKVYIVGDLFHSDVNNEWLVFEKFVSQYTHCSWYLIRGNHDLLPTYLLRTNHIQSASTLIDGPFLFSHKPMHNESLYVISGHVHPGIVLKGKGRQNVKLPCFYFSKNYALLPAFGKFTGLDVISPKAGDSVYAITDTHVVPINESE
jgi:DNA ligase-associated metallophosphoesterase